MVAAGEEHSVYVINDGTVRMKGRNSSGQITVPAHIQKRKEFIVQAECGSLHTLLLTASGNLIAFGDNSYGQLGNGIHTSNYVFTQIATGERHSIML